MLKCSYILYVHNNEETISKVIDSLTKINGNFRREFIIIEDGSTDNSLYIIKNHIKSLPRATVITQEHTGSAISINKALNLIKSDYVHFVSAMYETHPDETAKLIDACAQHNTEVAFYSNPHHKKSAKDKTIEIIDTPVKEILTSNRFSNIRNIGEASSLISFNLLLKVDGADEEIYTLYPSLALRCAVSSKFACLFKDEERVAKEQAISQQALLNFNHYNELLAVYNFIRDEPKVAENYIRELIYNLYQSAYGLKQKLNFLRKYSAARYLGKYNLDKVKEWYFIELKKLF